ncbi:MAG: hypothetical protein U1F30_11765 [Steroidobacteraceae bacterium]
MNRTHRAVIAVIASCSLGSLALAADAADTQQRNVNQQQRILQGLDSGALSTGEAARLEREQAHVDRLETRALRDGSLSGAEAARIDTAQDLASRDIYRQKHDAQLGDPDSRSSERLQADVGRNVAQQERIQQGLDSGALTDREAARLEHGQARTNRIEANSAADGRVGPLEQARIQSVENRQSRHIYRKKHNLRRK